MWIQPRAPAVLSLNLYNQDASSISLVIALLASSLEQVRILDYGLRCTDQQRQLLVDLLGICRRLRLVTIELVPRYVHLQLHQLRLLPSLRNLTVDLTLQAEEVSTHCSGLTSLFCHRLRGSLSTLAPLSSLVQLRLFSCDPGELANLSCLTALTKLILLHTRSRPDDPTLTVPVHVATLKLHNHDFTQLKFSGSFEACRVRELKIFHHAHMHATAGGITPVLADPSALQGLTSLTYLSFSSASQDLPALDPSWSALQHLKELSLHASGSFHSLQALGSGALLPLGLPTLSCRARQTFTFNLQAFSWLTALQELNVRCKFLALESPIVDVLQHLQKIPTVRIETRHTRQGGYSSLRFSRLSMPTFLVTGLLQ